jgi:hypothetical protein
MGPMVGMLFLFPQLPITREFQGDGGHHQFLIDPSYDVLMKVSFLSQEKRRY